MRRPPHPSGPPDREIVALALPAMAARTADPLMGADAEVVPLARTYLRLRALAAAPVLIVAVGHGAFRARKDMRAPLSITAGANATNTGAASAFLVLGRRAFPARFATGRPCGNAGDRTDLGGAVPAHRGAAERSAHCNGGRDADGHGHHRRAPDRTRAVGCSRSRSAGGWLGYGRAWPRS
ncbi:MAG: hypothetical protein ACRDYA_08590 [Egibacteraceae bacterium]